jgi:hypothetical protein
MKKIIPERVIEACILCDFFIFSGYRSWDCKKLKKEDYPNWQLWCHNHYLGIDQTPIFPDCPLKDAVEVEDPCHWDNKLISCEGFRKTLHDPNDACRLRNWETCPNGKRWKL